MGNRISEDNLIRTELVENVPFKASLVFAKIPATVTKIALLQVPLNGGITTVAKFRNLLATIDPVTPTVNAPKIVNPEVSSNNSLICPDRTKILYRAVSKSYLMYICGFKNPTHYVGIAKDGTQGITLRLRSYDRTRFSASNGNNSYTIATDRLIIKKDGDVIQEKIEVLQPLAAKVTIEDSTPKINPQKSTTSNSTNNIPKRKVPLLLAPIIFPERKALHLIVLIIFLKRKVPLLLAPIISPERKVPPLLAPITLIIFRARKVPLQTSIDPIPIGV